MAAQPDQPLADIGGYRVLRVLRTDRTWLAEGVGGRRVVLKVLEEDCLLRGQLHANIRERLERVRELAHGKVANLYGVERIGQQVYLVWEYVDGQTWEERGKPGEAARDLVRAVEGLHARGIVHGAIHGRNVLIDSYGHLRLTHISPLLYNDVAEDIDAVARLLGRQPSGSNLRDLASPAPPPVPERGDRRSTRWWPIVAAIAVAGLSLALAYGLWRWADARIPKPSVPLEAPRMAR